MPRRAVLVVGLTPSSPVAPGDTALKGSDSLKRLAAMAGVTEDEFLDAFDTVNLVPEYLGPDIAWGDALDNVARVRRLARRGGYRQVVTLGRMCGHALLGCHSQWFEWVEPWPNAAGAVSPHPSGTNRWWNDQDHVAAGQEFWCSLYRQVYTMVDSW